MKILLTLLIAFCSYSCFSQSLSNLETELYSKLNSHHGFGLAAFKENGKKEVIYNSDAWFNIDLDHSLIYNHTEIYISGKYRRERPNRDSINLADIKSFEFQEIDYKDYQSSDKSLNQEIITSPMLSIQYEINGKINSIRAGFQLKGDKNIIQELNQLIKEIQKKL